MIPQQKHPTRIPPGWHPAAAAHWQQGRRSQAIQATLQAINQTGNQKPLPLVMQLVYYLFLQGDTAAAAGFLEHIRPQYPDHPELLQNLAALHARAGQHQRALDLMDTLRALTPGNPYIFDTLTHCHHQLGQLQHAAEAGTTALTLKDQTQAAPDPGWQCPPEGPASWAIGKTAVVAFSLWGDQPRYLRGALDNALAIPQLYPRWQARYYVDDSVPGPLLDALTRLGADVRVQPGGQTQRLRLGWRFSVANDPAVGYFLVRDVDSLVSPREVSAVQAWLRSGQWFHVMRDWWTHTDLMLAGMWGGVAGVLPDLQALLRAYVAPFLDTPNIDQWFLRDCVWRYVRSSCLVHDRCFAMPGAQPWPQAAPLGNEHVGQDVFAARREEQARRLAPWRQALPCLQLPA